MLTVVERRTSWQVPRAELLPLEQTYPVSVVQDTGPRSYAEADLYAYAVSYRRRETSPPTIPRFPLGTWCIDTMNGLWQLRRYALRDLWFLPQNNPYATQDDRGYFSDVWPWVMQKYVYWLKEGNEPPPLRGIETRDGSIRVTVRLPWSRWIDMRHSFGFLWPLLPRAVGVPH